MRHWRAGNAASVPTVATLTTTPAPESVTIPAGTPLSREAPARLACFTPQMARYRVGETRSTSAPTGWRVMRAAWRFAVMLVLGGTAALVVGLQAAWPFAALA